jgi:hypothetical protein
MSVREISCGLDTSDSEQGQVVGCCEHGNEHSDSIKGEELVDQLSDYQLHNCSAQIPLSYCRK